jgi:hypothetical protein
LILTILSTRRVDEGDETMAGELCGTGCGFCGRCDGQWDEADEVALEVDIEETDAVADEVSAAPAADAPGAFPVCLYCGADDCGGQCPAYYDAMESWIDEERYERDDEQEVA